MICNKIITFYSDKTLNNTHEYTLDPYNGGPVYRSVGPEPYPKSSGVPYLYGMDPVSKLVKSYSLNLSALLYSFLLLRLILIKQYKQFFKLNFKVFFFI